MAVFNLDKSHHGKKVTCEKGDTIVLRLPENPTTGYKWHILESDGLTKTDDQFELDKQAGENTMGSGGERTLTFEIRDSGKATLYLEYFQEWEGRESSSEIFKLQIN